MQTIDPTALLAASNGSAVANGASAKGKERATDADGADAGPPVIDQARLDKERALAELLELLSDPPASDAKADASAMQTDGDAPAPSSTGAYRPIIPDELAAYYLQRAGFECTDVRVVRLFALAAQKFVSDVAADAYQFARTRTGGGPGRGRGTGASAAAGDPSGLGRGRGAGGPATRTVLTMEDLSSAMSEYGVNVSRAPYYL